MYDYDGYPQSAISQPQPQRKKAKWPYYSIGAGLLLLGLMVTAIVLRQSNVIDHRVPLIGADSGYATCVAISNENQVLTSEKDRGSAEKKMSEADYKKLRSLFADSRYTEIRENGTKFVDLLWQLQGLSDDNAMAALPLVGPLTESYTGLSGGCASLGITIPALGSS